MMALTRTTLVASAMALATVAVAMGAGVEAKLPARRHSSAAEDKQFADKLPGAWVAEVGEMRYRGFKLGADGTAESIHRYTVFYRSWSIANGAITLVAERFGEHGPSVEEETYLIEQITDDTLSLRTDRELTVYTRQ